MLNQRPRIGITGPDKGGTSAWIFTALSVFIAGGFPIRLRPSGSNSSEKLQGLIIGGGADVDPDTYGHEHFLQEYLNRPFKNKRKRSWRSMGVFLRRLSYPLVYYIRRFFTGKMYLMDKDRDQLEFKLLDEAVKKNIPVLGICRGAQLINVYFKGTLYEDIDSLYIEEVNKFSILPVKKIFLNSKSKLAEILHHTVLKVNALHHQAVKEAGVGIAIVAREANGIVQAIESVRHDFIIGVQWHPEYLIRKKDQRRIFEALVSSAGKGVKK